MFVRLNVGQITDPKTELVDNNLTLAEVAAQYNLTGEITLNGSSLSQVDKRTTLAELGVQTDDYLCSARKNGGN
jgi:hypothetical protein